MARSYSSFHSTENATNSPGCRKYTLGCSNTLDERLVSDGRDQTLPGWSVSGQVGDFTDGTHASSGSHLGWSPTAVAQNAAHDGVAGAPVRPGATPGLQGGGVLATRRRPTACTPPC
ncbi:hypothetical protein [Dactylosporangium sp. CA-139066]|uniref:hypothetical protein n=1 Tax=Dactylosporangium sp. CA-139066 TaxID=3239930 RepID=UPI003D92A148